MVVAVPALLKVTAVPGIICADAVLAAPTSITLVLVLIPTTGAFFRVEKVTESPTATLALEFIVNAVVPIPAVDPAEIAVVYTVSVSVSPVSKRFQTYLPALKSLV